MKYHCDEFVKCKTGVGVTTESAVQLPSVEVEVLTSCNVMISVLSGEQGNSLPLNTAILTPSCGGGET